MITEWGVVALRDPDELQYGPTTEQKAREWVREWDEEYDVPGVFIVVFREVSDWMPAA